MLNALEYSLAELEDIITQMNEPKFRAKQVYTWLTKGVDFSSMTNLPKSLIHKLSEKYVSNGVEIYSKLISKVDGTRKYIFKLQDGNIIEGVLMSYKYGNTICISTQVGCRMNCSFCASTLDGLVRNMTAGEMLGEVIAVNNDISKNGERCITNIVLMGSGEPLDNYDNVVKFLNLVSSSDGLNISRRNISLSTCGIVPNIYRLSEDMKGVTLTISLHAPNDKLRSDIMPVNNAYSIKELIDACRYYFEVSGRRIIFEYSMIKGKNDSDEIALELSKLLKGLPCHVNLISLNYVKERGLHSTSQDNVLNFKKILEKNGISTTIRRSMGSDIEGACGQLRRKILKENNLI